MSRVAAEKQKGSLFGCGSNKEQSADSKKDAGIRGDKSEEGGTDDKMKCREINHLDRTG